jgi:hypothetical protein
MRVKDKLSSENGSVVRSKRIFITFIFAAILLFIVSVENSQAQARWQPPVPVYEGINNQQSWTGLTQFDRFGRPFITYNLNQLQRMPEYMRVWVRAHEYGHVNRIPLGDSTESGADCWAAQQLSKSDPDVFRSVIWYMDNVQGNYAADQNHGTGHQQAAWVRQCAGW